MLKKISLVLFLLVLVAGIFFLWKNRQSQVLKEEKKEERIIQESEKAVSRLLSARKDLSLEKIRELRLERLSSVGGVKGLNETDQYVEEIAAKENPSQITNSQISNYQTYVTPSSPAVLALAKGKTYQQIYEMALRWVWIEDEILNGTGEKWLLPEIFLTQTPTMQTNPVLGKIASDCESQAYTLVSVLRAAGMPAEKVRVVTGKVNFGGIVGGHAWVEIYDEKTGWFQLEATSGDFYDSQKKQLVSSSGLEYDYFQKYQYPSVAKWTMFNDQYFFDINRGQGVAPEIWFDEETAKKRDNFTDVTYQLPDALKKLREERADSLREELFKISKQEFKNKLRNLQFKTLDESTQANGGTISNLDSEQIANQILLILEQLEKAVAQGATPEQKDLFKTKATESLEKANQMLASSTQLSPEKKQEIQSFLDQMEALLVNGLNPVQVMLLKKEALNFLNQLEADIESGEIKDVIKNKRDQLKSDR